MYKEIMDYSEEHDKIDPLGLKSRKLKLLRIITKQQIIFRKLKSTVPKLGLGDPNKALKEPRKSQPQNEDDENTPTGRKFLGNPNDKPIDNHPTATTTKTDSPPRIVNSDSLLPNNPEQSSSSVPSPTRSSEGPQPKGRSTPPEVNHTSSSPPPPPSSNLDHNDTSNRYCSAGSVSTAICVLIMLALLLYYMDCLNSISMFFGFGEQPISRVNIEDCCIGKRNWVI